MAERPWVVEREPEGTAALRQAGYSRVTAALLAARGAGDAESAKRFLECGEKADWGEPLELLGMEAASKRLAQAVAKAERIVVYGDYDADGVTSTALLLSYLKEAGAKADYYVPDRESEGYGLNMEAAEGLAKEGAQVVVTVDTGISAFAEAERLEALGVCLIVTDHHEPRETVPKAYAVVDPKLPGCPYPYKELAGVGVAFKLVCAVEARGRFLGASPRRLFQKYGPLVCLGTVADVVPLTGENRALVSRGLPLVEAGAGCGVAALLEVAGCRGKRLTATSLSFTATPRINACGRVASARDAVGLLMEDDPARALELARGLDENNARRKELEAAIAEEAVQKIDGNEALRLAPLLIVSGEGWHSGVIGIVASRLTERYGKPAVVVSFEGDEGRASCRSIPGFNIHAALMACAPLLARFGGHELAAGFTVKRENYGALYQALQRQALAMPEPPVLCLRADLALSGGEISLSTARDIRALEPFGSGNPEPLFYIPAAQILEARPVGKDGSGHLRLLLRCDGYEFAAIFFRAQENGFCFSAGDVVDVMARLDVNLYRNTENLSVIVRAVRRSACFGRCRALYASFLSGAPVSPPPAFSLLPEHREFAAVYRRFRAAPGLLDLEQVFQELLRADPRFNYFKLLLIADVFAAEGVFSVRFEGESRAEITPLPLPPGHKADLEASPLMLRAAAAPRAGREETAPGREPSGPRTEAAAAAEAEAPHETPPFAETERKTPEKEDPPGTDSV